MKIVVFGASGLIGLAVTTALVAQGHDVIGIVRSETGAALVHKAGATPLIGDMPQPATWTEAVVQAGGVIQLAASFDGDLGAAERAWLDPMLELARNRPPDKAYLYRRVLAVPHANPPRNQRTNPFRPARALRLYGQPSRPPCTVGEYQPYDHPSGHRLERNQRVLCPIPVPDRSAKPYTCHRLIRNTLAACPRR